MTGCLGFWIMVLAKNTSRILQVCPYHPLLGSTPLGQRNLISNTPDHVPEYHIQIDKAKRGSTPTFQDPPGTVLGTHLLDPEASVNLTGSRRLEGRGTDVVVVDEVRLQSPLPSDANHFTPAPRIYPKTPDSLFTKDRNRRHPL